MLLVRIWSFLKGHWKASLAGLVVIAAGLGTILELPEKLSSAWEALFGSDTSYEILISKNRLRLGEEATANLFITDKTSHSSMPVTDRNCLWSYNPNLSAANNGPQCTRVLIRPERGDFAGQPGSVTPLELRVRVWRAGDRPPDNVAQPSAALTIELVNQYAPAVSISNAPIELRRETGVSVTFPAGGAPPSFSCRWTPAERFVEPNKCQTKFIAPPQLSGSSTAEDVKIEVEILQTAEAGSTSAQATVKVVRPPSRYYLFVLDTTERMRPDGQLPSLFDAMVAQVSSALRKIDVGGGYYGATVFGGESRNGTRDCDRVRSLSPLSPVAPDDADKALHGLAIGGQQAPLARAVESALKEYAPYRDSDGTRSADRFVFVVLTAGGDTCGGGDLLALLRSALDSDELRGVAFGNRVLRIVLAMARREDEQRLDDLLKSDAYYREGQQTAILKAGRGETLARALDALGRMSTPDRAASVSACWQLRDLFDSQGNKPGSRIVNNYCQAL